MDNIRVFFRNDDVRGALDKSLLEITSLFIKYQIPIAHAVEPANLSNEVIDWILDIKERYPHLIEIIQHGYDHRRKNEIRNGEFGGQRSYYEQFEDIKNGKELMNRYFSDKWFAAFCFPNGPYNFNSMKALVDNGFKVVNGGWEIDIMHKIFYFTAHLFNKELLLGYRVPYNLRFRPKNNIFQINMNISFIDEYFNEETNSSMLSLEQLKSETTRFKKLRTIGVLLHHRYHDTNEKIKLVDNYLSWLKTQTIFQFSTMEGIYNNYTL